MLETSEKFSKWCAGALVAIGSVTIIAMMVHVMAEVAARTFFNNSIPGTEELVSGYYMIIVVFLPLAFVQLERGHVIIELFTLKASDRTKSWIDGIVYLICSGALAIYAYAGFNKAVEMTQKGEFWVGLVDVTIWPSRWIMPIGIAVMGVVMFLQAIRELQAASSGRNHHDPKPIEKSEPI